MSGIARYNLKHFCSFLPLWRKKELSQKKHPFALLPDYLGACYGYLLNSLGESYKNNKRHLCLFSVGANGREFAKCVIEEFEEIPLIFHVFDKQNDENQSHFQISESYPNLLNYDLRCLTTGKKTPNAGPDLNARIDKETKNHLSQSLSRDFRTLDEFCRVNHIKSIDLLRIELNESRLAVLEGALEMFKSQKIMFASVEYQSVNKGSVSFPMALWNLISTLKGYHVYRITRRGYIVRFKNNHQYQNKRFSDSLLLVRSKRNTRSIKNPNREYTFDEGMMYSSAYLQSNDPHLWFHIKKRFSEFQNMERDRANSIPKKLHQIWFGSELPAQYAPLIKKLKELHPDWEYKLWNENNINFDLINPEFFQRATNPGQKSDILRYEILNQFGGVYLDLDHAAINRFDHLLFLESFAGVTYDGAPQITNSVIGSRPRSPLTQKLCRFEAGFIENPNVKEIFQTTGPDFFTKVFNSLILENPGMVAFPNAYFSPYPNFPKDRVKGNDFNRYLKKETICCHLWHCSWIKTNT